MSAVLPVGHLVVAHLSATAAARLDVPGAVMTVSVVAEHPDGWTVERYACDPVRISPGDVLAWIDVGPLPDGPAELAAFRRQNLPARTARLQGDPL
jgi:hypothetical protein